jgi:hypothetical protein
MVVIGETDATIGTVANFAEDVITGEDIVSIIIITALIAIAVTTGTVETVETVETTGLVNIHRHLAYGISYKQFPSAYLNHNA